MPRKGGERTGEPERDVAFVKVYFPRARVGTRSSGLTDKQQHYVHDGSGMALGSPGGGPWSAWKSAAATVARKLKEAAR